MARIANNDAALTAFIARWEGFVNYIYGDSLALPTIGVGHLLGGTRAANATLVENAAVAIHQRYGFQFRSGHGAGDPSDTNVRQEVQRFLALSAPKRRDRDHLRAHVVQLELSDASCRNLFADDMHDRINDIYAGWPSLARQPREVQIAMIDFAFNGGVPGLLRRSELRDLIDRSAWNSAADRLAHGGPDGISRRAVRNNARAELVRNAPRPVQPIPRDHSCVQR